MSDIQDIRKNAIAYRKLKNYEEAAVLFHKLWYEHKTNDIWDGWGLAVSLNKLKRYREAF